MENMRLVLVSCCAPCSAGAIRQLANGEIPGIAGVDDFIVYFYNPNIFPADEYQKRMAEQIKYCDSLGVKYFVDEYDHDAWRNAVRGLEHAPERGPRCGVCFKFRIARAAKWAAEHGYNSVATVLGVSRHKSQPQVDSAAHDAVTGTTVKYVEIKWDEQLRQQINRETDFYRQKYCGCEFSLRNTGQTANPTVH